MPRNNKDQRTDPPVLDVFADVSAACAALAKKDAMLARAVDAIGSPHIRRRPGGFEAVARIIVEQQVSVAAAQAIWKRCTDQVSPMSAQNVLAIKQDDLCACGLSRPKATYIHALAEAVVSGDVDFMEIAQLDDESAAAQLINVKGIGPWSAAIYLLFCEGRVDIWPQRDVALLGAYNAARKRGPDLEMGPFDEKAQKWRPYRGIAAHILWTYYAHIRGRTPI